MSENRCGDCHKCCEHYTLELTELGGATLQFSRVWGVCSESGFMSIEIEIPCQHLTKDGCDIYEDRPQTCRDFVCDRLMEGD